MSDVKLRRLGPRNVIHDYHIDQFVDFLAGIEDAYDVAVKNGYTGTRGQWLDSLKGEKGDPGAGLAPIGSAETVDDLPDSGNTVGDVRTVDADGRAYRWSGSAWVDVGLFRGPGGEDTELRARVDPGEAITQTMSMRGGPTKPYVAPSAMVLPEDFAGGTVAGTYANHQPYIQSAIDAAELAGDSGAKGAPVGLLYGTYWIDSPLILPRTNITPGSVVHIRGQNEWGSRLRGRPSFPTGRALIESDPVAQRISHVKITDLHLHLPDVDQTMAMWWPKVGTGADATEWNQALTLENIYIECTNSYHERLIVLETGMRTSGWRNVYADPGFGAGTYDTVLLETNSTEYNGADPQIGYDTVGVGYSHLANIHPMLRRGGRCVLFRGRIHSSDWSTSFLNGTTASASLDLINSHQSVFRNIRTEGYQDQPQIKITRGAYLTFDNCGLGGPTAQQSAWTASTAYAVGAKVVQRALRGLGGTVTSKKVWRVTVAGTSGATEPVWPASGSVVDGGVTWTEDGDAVGNGVDLIASRTVRWTVRSSVPGSTVFSLSLVKAVTMDADCADCVFTDFDVRAVSHATVANEFDIQGVRCLVTGRSLVGGTGSTTYQPYAVGTMGADLSGAGSPEGVIVAPPGSTWRRTDGGAGTSLYVKESGSGNTGWVAK